MEFDETADLDLFDFIHLKDYLRDLLGIKVDLVMKSELKPIIGKYVLEETIYL